MYAVEHLKLDVERDRNHVLQANDDGAHAMEDLEAKVDRHAKAAIFYRGEQDKKYDKLRDLTMCAISRGLENQSKVRELERQNELQKKHIGTLVAVVMRLKQTMTQLKVQGTPGKTAE